MICSNNIINELKGYFIFYKNLLFSLDTMLVILSENSNPVLLDIKQTKVGITLIQSC